MFFFASVSGYVYLEGWPSNNELFVAEDLLVRSAEMCQRKTGADLARCFVRWGAANYGVRLYSVRYDERGKVISRIDVKKL